MTNPTGNEAFLAVAGENRENLISYADYQALEDKSGKYMVYDYSWCEAYNEGNHEVTGTNPCVGLCSVCNNNVVNHNEDEALSVTIEYADYAAAGAKIYFCTNEGCTHKVTEEVKALFTCLGYSAPENGVGGITVGYTVNGNAIDEYTRITGKTLDYGVFAVSKEKLGDNYVFDENGVAISGAINAKIARHDFAAFELKIVGFADAQKDIKLAMGAYVAVTNGENTKYSYIQSIAPGENEKYSYISYNDVVGSNA